jgi:LysM repeat protein
MKDFRQVFLGFGAALLSVFFVLGSFSIAFTESGMVNVALRLTEPVNLLPTQILPLTSVPLPSVNATPSPVFSEEASPVPSETALPAAVACSFPPNWFRITVQMGDTLNSLAAAYGTTTELLVQGNCLVIENLIAGMVIYVPVAPTTTPEETCGPPPGWLYYTVQYGDTLYSISQMVGASIHELQLANCMVGQTNIRAGQRLYVPFIPASAKSPTPTLVNTDTPPPSATPWLVTSTPVVLATRTSTQPVQPSRTPTPTMSPVPEDTATPTVTITPSFTPTNLPTETPSVTPLPTETPLPLPTETPTTGSGVP